VSDDERAVPLVRADGSRIAVTVVLGGGARVSVEVDDPPVLVIDTGHCEVLIEPSPVDGGAVAAVASLAQAAARLLELLTARRDESSVVSGGDGR
jgi:hypothetical protein